MTRIRYTMPARSQGKLQMQRAMAELVEKDEKDEKDEALIKAMGLNPHLSVCRWPFCLAELDGNE